jgi:tetratricopeptide (TPR) repeat protein
VRSLCLLGELHGASGRAHEGLDLTETAVALDPDDAEARSFLALRYASLGFYESAVAACDEALQLDPIWDLARQAKALYSSQCGDHDTALAALAELHGVAVPSSLSGAILAGVLVTRGDLPGAERALADARAWLSPQQDSSYVEILAGLVAALRRDQAPARRVFEVQRDSPPRIFDHLLRLSLALGEHGAALAQFEASPYHCTYRWLVTEALARPFLREPGFRKLLEQLHEEWLGHLERLGPRLPVAPPELPTPAAILAGGSR